MKLVVLAYLEDDAEAASKLLADHDVVSFSEVPVDGHGPGTPGWHGEAPSFRSRMAVAFLDPDRAAELLEAVRECRDCQDCRHPIHAWMLDVERAVVSSP